MKYLLLAGTLGALLLLPLVIANTPNAYANIFLIDNFTDDGVAGVSENCDQMLINATVANFTAFQGTLGLSEVISGVRECQMQLLQDNPPDTTTSTVVELDGMYRHMSGPGIIGMSYLQYDGNLAGTGSPTMQDGIRLLSLDVTDSDNLRIQYSFADFDVNVNATIIDGGGDSATLNGVLDGGTNVKKNLDFLLTDFFDENNALDLADIDEINVNFTNTVVAADYTLEFIQITMQPVGGSIMPAEMTALLLAGAELNALWILPAIAAIGIGAFVVLRKR